MDDAHSIFWELLEYDGYNDDTNIESLWERAISISKKNINQLYYYKTQNIATETDQEKVLRIVKGDFEKKFGMPLDRFNEVLGEIYKNNPEKLI